MGQSLSGAARGVADAIERVKVPRWVVKGAAVAGGIDGIGPSWTGPGKLLRRRLGGQVVDGPPGSAARRASPYGHGSHLAVTDRRLVVLKAARLLSSRLVSEDPPEWALPREQVAHARPAPRALGRARFELGFTDGSRIVLSGCPPHLSGWHARQIARALSG